jgi:hypothetical protein
VINYYSDQVDLDNTDTGQGDADLDRLRSENSDDRQENAIIKEFCPGSIHSEDVRDFWRTELCAGEWVMDVLQEGYVIPFVENPPAYEENNNKSAINDMPFVLQAVADLKKVGVIEFRDEKPTCVSPFTVSKKYGRDVKIKN